jgi:hypothetical protein
MKSKFGKSQRENLALGIITVGWILIIATLISLAK